MEAFIFDLDGVIVFTDKFHYQAWKQIADEMGIYFDEKINSRLRGVSRMESLEIILERYSGPKLSESEKEQLAAKKNDVYRSLLATMTRDDVTDDVRNTLAQLKKLGYKLAIGSSSKNTKSILEKVGLTQAFDAISDGTNISKSKPDPEVFIKAAEFIGVSPDKCIVVEDAIAGFEAAKSGGMMAAGIGPDKDYGKVDYKLEKFSDLLNLAPDINKK